ncbi:MAG: hypothetical protein MRERV_16c016 [Mycoplasmataceae bacterium RV_VA103A]|nr:MAG: hypothetical protein MRERV_16c016 [Mycoplasmataceae bacterium RV_VA103A]
MLNETQSVTVDQLEQLQRENLELQKKVLENEIAKLTKLAADNLQAGEDLLEKKLVDNINAYLENNRRIEAKITEYRKELTEIEKQLTPNEQVAQVENPQQ